MSLKKQKWLDVCLITYKHNFSNKVFAGIYNADSITYAMTNSYPCISMVLYRCNEKDCG